MSRIGDNATNYAAGAGVWYGMRFIIAFYPALIITLCIVGMFFDQELREGHYGDPWLVRYDGNAYIVGIILFLVLTVVLGIMITNIRETWGVVVFLYVITFFPFMKWLGWLFTSGAPWPGVNWIPWL